MRIKKLLLAIATLTLVSAAPVKHQFTAAEQQQISISTPGLFDRSDAFSIDLGLLKPNEYSFPLPVGKATMRKNDVVQIDTKDGDNVKAMFDGTVRLARKHQDMGYVIVIRHRNGLRQYTPTTPRTWLRWDSTYAPDRPSPSSDTATASSTATSLS